MMRSLFLIFSTVAVCFILSCSDDGNGDRGGVGPDGRPRANFSAQPLEIEGLRGDVTAISSGSNHSCALVSGEVWCWGGDFGALNQIKGITGSVSEIVSGDGFSCALSQGTVWCWGKNQYGQLGRGTVSEKEASPAMVVRLSGVDRLSAKAEQACAVTAGTVYCWGNKTRLGFPTPPQVSGDAVSTPALLRELSSVTMISVGGNHTCAFSKGNVFCWGDNKFGQLGIEGDAQSGDSFDEVEGLPIFENTRRVLSAGADHTCLLQRGDAVAWTFCWGKNDQGQLAQGEAGPSLPTSASAVDVGVHDLNLLTAGRNHTCAVNGQLVCWGDNSYSQLGATDVPVSHSPAAVAGLSGAVTAVSSGEDHTCAVVEKSRVQCWGSNQNHQLGR